MELQSAVLQHMRSGVLVEDADGRIVNVNPAFCDLFGIEAPPEILEGSMCADAAQASAQLFADPEGFLTRIAEILEAREPVVAERIALRDGRILERDYVPILHESRYSGTLWQYVDVTQQATAQDALREAKEMAEAANAHKSDFLATLSHEIRTPLNAILGMTSLALGTTLDTEQRSLLRSVRTNSEALIHLLSDILDVTQIEAGQMSLDEVAFDPAGLVEEVAEVLAVRAAAKDIRLVVDVGNDLPGRVLGDPNRTRQVLMNVVGNAVKYTAVGRVVIRARKLGSSAKTVQVRIEVEDTGPGMPPEVVRRVFDRFYRGHLGAAEGTGLGLAISDQLVERMGGTLNVHSQVGVGSTFYADLEWPIASLTDERQTQTRRRLRGKRAWIAHPDEAARFALEHILTAVGITARAVPDADQLRAGFAQHSSDVVIVDQAVEGPPLAPTIHLHDLGDRPPSHELVHPLPNPATRESIWQALLQIFGDYEPSSGTWDLVPLPDVERAKILVVEDNVDNQRVASSLLERVGHAVEIAEDGGQGLAALASGDFDLVLLDVDLPDRSGLDVAREVRRTMRWPPPLLAFTAHADEHMRAACLEAGMSAFLSKPVAPHTLLDTVAHWLGRTVGPRPRVLIADDAPDSRKLLLRFLDGLDLDLDEVDRAAPVLTRAKAGEVDLVLLDVEMPDTDGLEVLASLREDPRTAHLPVILVTGHGIDHVKDALQSGGPTAYVVKPVRPKALADQVRRLLAAAPRPTPAPAPAPAAPEPVDPDILALRPGFVRRSLDSLTRAREALANADLATAQGIGHQLKGTGTSFGLPAVSALGADLQAARAPEEALGIVEALVEQLGQVPID